ncbi:MAG: anti-sigma factor [Actinomycetota bacterium]|jgi:hypothetical protein|nr:MAG: hypothetical protein FD127_3770 [Acidimicrobiaceae bacterium]
MDDDGSVDDGQADLAANVVALLADQSMWAQPDPSVELRVIAAIGAERERAAPLSANATARSRWWRDPRVTALAGAAAAALVVGLIVGRGSSEPDEWASAATISMVGTDLAPAVSGEATISTESSGVRIAVRVPGLPRRDGGQYYEGWLRSCDGERLAPIGTFHDLADAVGWAGVAIDEYPVISFTKEAVAAPDSDEQASSGEVVLRGQFAPCP